MASGGGRRRAHMPGGRPHTEFMPYVFQILAQLLELQQGTVSPAYIALLGPIMTPVVWEQAGAYRPSCGASENRPARG